MWDPVAHLDEALRPEEHARRGRANLAKADAGDERDAERADQRLGDHDHVTEARRRGHRAVADGREGLHAEVERVLQVARARRPRRSPAARRKASAKSRLTPSHAAAT